MTTRMICTPLYSRFALPFVALSVAALSVVALGACGDDATGPGDTADTTTPDTSSPDTGEPDATTQDTSSPDTSSPDTSSPDTSSPDTSEPDTSTPDTSGPETTESCACGSSGSCLEANNAEGCPTLLASCGGGLERLDACPSDDLWATCERSSTTSHLYYMRIEDWLADAAEACASTLTGVAGTFTMTPVGEPSGDVCSCQRSASACVQAYGAVCDTITCDAGIELTPCATDNIVPGRCVTRDGNRELIFYAPASEEMAETSCIVASGSEYYWYPFGL